MGIQTEASYDQDTRGERSWHPEMDQAKAEARGPLWRLNGHVDELNKAIDALGHRLEPIMRGDHPREIDDVGPEQPHQLASLVLGLQSANARLLRIIDRIDL